MNMKPSILIIDDDHELCELLSRFLSLEGFTVALLHSLIKINIEQEIRGHAMVVLDIMLPGGNGLDVLREIRKISSVPILMLTARGDDNDRILGLDLGADDYLAKPCNPRELTARIKAVLRRTEGQDDLEHRINLTGLKIHRGTRSASVDDVPLDLTGSEFNLLLALARDSGEAVSKESLCLAALHRKMHAFDRSVDVHISKLRKKLEQAKARCTIINIRGVGYQLTKPEPVD